MNSGKSAHIIMQVHNLGERGKNVLLLKPKVDTRDLGVVKSRALNTAMKANVISKDGRVDGGYTIYEYAYLVKPDYVFVDEVNFLSSSDVEELSMIVDNMDIPVFGYGLLVDYKGNLFEGSKRMVELADSIRELKSPCVICDRKATMHLRKVNNEYVFEGESISVGDVDSYDSVCRKCYNKAKESANKSKK